MIDPPLVLIRQRAWEHASRNLAEELSDLYESYYSSVERAKVSGLSDDRQVAAFNARRYLRFRSVAARQLVELGFAIACSGLDVKGDEQ